jgi:serine/threonine protein phosphatase PrpC
MRYIAVTALSHAGLVRDHNEDSLVVGPWTLSATETETPQTLVFPLGTPLVVAVADGLGGHPSGEVASALVVRQLAQDGLLLDSEETIRDELHACNRAVYAAAARDRELTMMGTTVAGVVITPDRAYTFNVGDSRVYVVVAGELRQLSVDDSPALTAGRRSTAIVTQTLGGNPEFTAVDPHIASTQLSGDERYLVCTDGLTDLVPPEVLGGVLAEHEDGRAAFELWKSAMAAGGADNVTLAVVRLGT